MKKQLKKVLAFSCLVLFISACKTHCSEVIDTSKVIIDVKLARLDQEFGAIKSKEQAIAFLKKHPLFTSYNLEGGKPVEVLIQEMLLLGNDQLDTLQQDVDKQFGDFGAQKTSLEDLFRNTKYYYPDFRVPEVNTLISGFGGFIIDDADSLMLIGLDYFLDSTAHYAPDRTEVPDYIKLHLNNNTIDTKAAFALSNRYTEYTNEQKLINQMIKYGKQYYFMRQVLPCKGEHELLDYTAEQWAEIKSNEFNVYSYFSKNELFYNTKAENNRLFIGERPNCVEIGDDCPGRIGRWLGYEIVKSYAEKTEATLQQIMMETDHVKIFTQSGYKPKKK